MDRMLKRKEGLTLTELLCVIAILLIVAALYLPAIARAYSRARAFITGLGG
jgi:prepilin-type N-terminal cleavage/methylation domain-containing protein